MNNAPNKTILQLESEDREASKAIMDSLRRKEISPEEFSHKLFEQDQKFKNEFISVMNKGKTKQ